MAYRSTATEPSQGTTNLRSGVRSSAGTSGPYSIPRSQTSTGIEPPPVQVAAITNAWPVGSEHRSRSVASSAAGPPDASRIERVSGNGASRSVGGGARTSKIGSRRT